LRSLCRDLANGIERNVSLMHSISVRAQVRVMVTYWGRCDVGIKCRWVSFTLRTIYPLVKRPSSQWTGEWMDPRAGLDETETNHCPFWELNPGLPARSLASIVRRPKCYSCGFTT